VSDIVVLNASHGPDLPLGIRAHFVSSGWSPFLAMATLPHVLRDIRIELIEVERIAMSASAHRWRPAGFQRPYSDNRYKPTC
jgi:hypothetical protein